jgi:predicted DNA-binding ribbon-helix-helix protein
MTLTRNALVSAIDRKRDQANLSSAVRLFVLKYYQGRQPAR